MVDTVLIANILPYWEYYWPMQIPLSDYDVKLIMITAVISLVSIIIMTFRINKAKIKTALLSIVTGNAIVVVMGIIVRRIWGGHITSEMLWCIVRPINWRYELVIIVTIFLYLTVAKIIAVIFNTIKTSKKV